MCVYERDFELNKSVEIKKEAPERGERIRRLCGVSLAVAVAFTSVYLFSGNRGAWQGVPFILFAPALSDVLCKNRRAVCVLYAVIAFFMSRIDAESIEYSVKYTAVVLGISIVSVFVKRLVVTAIAVKEKRGTAAAFLGAAILITVAALAVYPMYNGTYFGNIKGEEQNRAAFADKYGEAGLEYTVGNTYYSHKAGGYLTEMKLTDVGITAGYSANGRDEHQLGEIDGYENYCAKLMMDEASDDLKYILSYHYSSGIDFAVRPGAWRPGEYTGEGVLTPESRVKDYAEFMSFEIAFYDRIDSKDDFASLCRSYFGYIEESDFVYENITFYGVNGYTYQLTLPHGYTGDITANEVLKFDKSSFKKYSSDSDVKEYWK